MKMKKIGDEKEIGDQMRFQIIGGKIKERVQHTENPKEK